MYKNRVGVIVEAPLAMFAHTELKAEAYSYDMIPVSAARGILDAIYFHPQFKWVIDSITVCNEIVRYNAKTTGVGSKISEESVRKKLEKGKPIDSYNVTGKESQLYNNSFLKNVKYGIMAHVVLEEGIPTECYQKTLSIMNRRLTAGQCFRQPTCGRKELNASVKPWDGTPLPIHESLKGERDMGIIFHDFVFASNMDKKGMPTYRHVVLHDGVYNVEERE